MADVCLADPEGVRHISDLAKCVRKLSEDSEKVTHMSDGHKKHERSWRNLKISPLFLTESKKVRRMSDETKKTSDV